MEDRIYWGWPQQQGVLLFARSEPTGSEYEAIHDITTSKLIFLRSEYVKEVKKGENYSSRVLVLFNDKEMNAGNWKERLVY